MFTFFRKTDDSKNNKEQLGKLETEDRNASESQVKNMDDAEKKKAEAKKKAENEAKKKAEDEAKKKAEALAKEKNNIIDFVNVLTGVKGENLRNQFSISSSLNSNKPIITLSNSYEDLDISQKIGFVVSGFGDYASNNLFDSLLPYAKSGHHIVLLLDSKKAADETFDKKLDKIKQFCNVTIISFEDGLFDLNKILLGINQLNSAYTVFVTLKDKLNPRSFITNINTCISENPSKKCFVPSSIDLNKIEQYWNLSSLSGVIVDTRFILEINGALREDGDFWCLEKIVKNCKKDDLVSYNNEFVFNHYVSSKIHSLEIAKLGKEIISNLKKADFKDQIFQKLKLAIHDIYVNFELSKIQRFFVHSMVLYILYLCEKSSYDIELWKETFNKIFDFGIPLKAKETQRLFNVFLPIMFPSKSDNIFIIENYGMSDIKNSKFFALANEAFNVDHQLKRSNFDYYDFNNMIIKMHSKSSKLTIGSGSLNNNMLSEGDSHLTLWHGLGWMKKTVVRQDKFTVGDIVCSSEYCAPRYKEHFYANNAIPLGSIQTDYLFDKDFRNANRKEIREKYSIPPHAKVLFFAPTFRIGKSNPYYNFGIDINELAKELEKKEIYLITKKHHVFEHLLMDKGVDTSGVFDSENKHFIVDTHYEFNQLICACDCFVTDYSSGMYYAFAMNLPIFLYATDVKEYTEGPNGFEINYPDDVPVPFVGEASISKFIEAFELSFKYVNTDGYQSYRKNNVGACDGHVGERIVEYIKNNYL